MLQGRSALVTGSTQGIGLAIATALANAGADVVLHGLEDPAEGAPIAERVAAAGVSTTYVSADLTRSEEAGGLVDAAAGAIGSPLDIVVNNAGIQFTCPIESFPEDKWDAILAVDLTAAFHTIKAALPAMRERRWGRIVNVASVHGLVASVHKAAWLPVDGGWTAQ